MHGPASYLRLRAIAILFGSLFFLHTLTSIIIFI